MAFGWWIDHNRAAVLAEVCERGMALMGVAEEYASDPDIVLAAIGSNPEAVRYASKELCLDRQFALEAVERNWQVVHFLPEALQSDRAIVLAAVRKDRGALNLALSGRFVNFLFTPVAAEAMCIGCEGWYRLDPSAGLRNSRPVYVSKKRRRALVARGCTRWAVVAGCDLAKALEDPTFPALLEAEGGTEPDDCHWDSFAVQRSGALQDDPTLVADLLAGIPASKVAAFYEGECLRLVGRCNDWRTTDSFLRFHKLPPGEVPSDLQVARHRLTVRVGRRLSFHIASCIRPSAFRIFPGGEASPSGGFLLKPHCQDTVLAAVGTMEAARERMFCIEQPQSTISIYVDIAEGFAACFAAPGEPPGVAVWYEIERTKPAEEFEFTNELPPVVLTEDVQDPVAQPTPLGPNALLRHTGIAGLEVVVDAQTRSEMAELIGQARELSEACFGDFVTERDWDEAQHCVALLVDTACFAAVGYCLYNTDDGHMWISQVAVQEALRGRGLGAELVVWAAREAQIRGYKAVRLKSATTAIDFYLRMGFKAVKSEKDENELEELGFTQVPEMELLPPQMVENERKAAERVSCLEREKAAHQTRQAEQLRCAAQARDMAVWNVVGGEDRGGVLVRLGQELGSPKAIERLSTGALVQQVQLVTLQDEDTGEKIQRLHFRRLTGKGPDEGWVSVALNHKVLLERIETQRNSEVTSVMVAQHAVSGQRAPLGSSGSPALALEENHADLGLQAEDKEKEEANGEEEEKQAVRQQSRNKDEEQAEQPHKEALVAEATSNGPMFEQPGVQAEEQNILAEREDDCGQESLSCLVLETLQPGDRAPVGQIWEIIGGEDKGGVLVREGFDVGSAKAAERLSCHALVEELDLLPDGFGGERLHFHRLTGTGPNEGWLTVALNHKVLAQRRAPSEVLWRLADMEPSQGT